MENLMVPRSDERERMEQQLLTQIRTAGEVYLAAAEEYARISREYRETLDHPKGAHPEAAIALHRAADDERIAFEKYSEALEALTQLILQGRPPESAQGTGA